MHILTIGTDEKLFDPDSAVAKRVREYGLLAGSLDVIVLTTRSYPRVDLSPEVRVYATGSLTRLIAPRDAARIARRLPHHFDLVSVQDPFDSGLAGVAISREFGAPLHVQVHTDLFSAEYYRLSFLNKVRVQIARYVFRYADCVRVVSERVKRNLERASVLKRDTPVSVLPIWVDIQKMVRTPVAGDVRAQYPQFETLFLMASRLTREKNIEMAIRAFGELVEEFPKAGLLITGEGPMQSSLKKLVVKMGLEKSVIFVPWTQELSAYYKSADAFVLSSDFEGYGMTLIEAAAAGCPVVTTDVGCVGDVLGTDRVLVSAVRDERGLLASMRSVTRDPARAKALARMTQTYLARSSSHEEYLEKYKESWMSCGVR